MLLNIDGFNGPVFGFSYTETEKHADKMDASVLSAMAGGFVCVKMSQEVVVEYEKQGLAAQVDIDLLQSYVGKGVILADVDIIGKMPRKHLLALLYHEEGHLVHKHLEMYEGAKGLIMDMAIEIEADAYAASKVGKRTVRLALMRAMWHSVRRTLKRGRFMSVLLVLQHIGSTHKERFKALK